MLKESELKNEYQSSLPTLTVSKDELRLVPAKIYDLVALQGILKAVYEGESPWSNGVFLLELSEKKRTLYLKCLVSTKVTGFIGIRVVQSDAHITNLAILPEYQGNGLARELIKEAKKYALSKECLTVSLEVKTNNMKAITLYLSEGFQIIGVKNDYYKDTHEDAIDMILRLDKGE